jgi:FkbM family methyltransferase
MLQLPSSRRVKELARNPQARREFLERRARQAFFRAARRFTPAVAVDASDGRYFVSTSDPVIGFYTFMNGAFDTDTLHEGLALLRAQDPGFSLAGRTVLDIGANIGTQTVPLLRSCSAGRVVAIEPDAANATLLRQNIVANRLEDAATVLELALTDHDGVVELERSDVNPGDHRVRVEASGQPPRMGEDRRAVTHVSAARLDSLVEEGTIDADSVALMWMDTQGHEGHVLAGATRLLGRVPVITEYWPYGLRRAGGLDTFHALVAEHFEAVVDVQSARDSRPRRIAAADVASLAQRYSAEDDSRRAVTDLVLLASSSS